LTFYCYIFLFNIVRQVKMRRMEILELDDLYELKGREDV